MSSSPAFWRRSCRVLWPLWLATAALTPLHAAEPAKPAAEADYQALAQQFFTLSQRQSPLAYQQMLAEKLLSGQGDAEYQKLVALLKPHVPKDSVATLMYAAVQSQQAHKALLQAAASGDLTPEQQAQWQLMDKDPRAVEAVKLVSTLCQQQNLQACLAWFMEVKAAATPTIANGSREEQQAALQSLIAPENQVRQVAIMNFAQKASPRLARFIASLYERGLVPLDPRAATQLGYERDAGKAEQWRAQAEALLQGAQ